MHKQVQNTIMAEFDLKSLMQNSSIVGAGGAGFPSFGKLADGADTLVVNCAECEPLMYTDYMLMREHMSKIVEGAEAVKKSYPGFFEDITKLGAKVELK